MQLAKLAGESGGALKAPRSSKKRERRGAGGAVYGAAAYNAESDEDAESGDPQGFLLEQQFSTFSMIRFYHRHALDCWTRFKMCAEVPCKLSWTRSVHCSTANAVPCNVVTMQKVEPILSS